MPYKKHYKEPYKEFPPSPIEISFWETAKPIIPELEKEVWIDKKYRVDFLIPNEKIIIELYGYEYHNTKKKITEDAQRERYLQKAGYKVIRFTGTEIYKNVKKCVEEVLELTPNKQTKEIKDLLTKWEKENEKPQTTENKPTNTTPPIKKSRTKKTIKFNKLQKRILIAMGIISTFFLCTITNKIVQIIAK